MIIIGAPDRPTSYRRTRLMPDGHEIAAVHLIAPPAEDDSARSARIVADTPHAFMIQQAPHSAVNAHFHFSRQFQVVVRGSGHLGRHAVSPATVHYAAAETGYGPIVAGADGLWYLTLRQVTEFGAEYLPENAAKMHRGLKRRQYTGEPPSVLDESTVLIPADGAGLGAWVQTIPPDASLPPPSGEGGHDRYHAVIEGSVIVGESLVDGIAVIWRSADEPALPIVAGPEGATVAIVQFPGSA